MTKQTVFSWARAVQAARLPSLTKLALLNLRMYVNDVGEMAYPSLTRQMQDTTMSKNALLRHLRNGEEAGFLRITTKRNEAGAWPNNRYALTFPSDYELGGSSGEPCSSPSEHGSSHDEPWGGSSGDVGGSSGGINLVHYVDSKSPIEDSNRRFQESISFYAKEDSGSSQGEHCQVSLCALNLEKPIKRIPPLPPREEYEPWPGRPGLRRLVVREACNADQH